MFEDESSLQSLSSEQLKWQKKNVVHSLFENVVRDLSSPKVEDELNKNVGQWNQTKPEEEKDHLINTKHGILVLLNSRRRWPPDKEEFSRKETQTRPITVMKALLPQGSTGSRWREPLWPVPFLAGEEIFALRLDQSPSVHEWLVNTWIEVGTFLQFGFKKENV